LPVNRTRVPSRSTPARGACGPGCCRTETPNPAVFTIRASCCCGVGVASGVGDWTGVGGAVGSNTTGATAVGVIGLSAAVTRGVTAGVGTIVGGAGVLVARRVGRARPAFTKASAATAPIRPSRRRLLNTCQTVSRSRPPLDRNGLPHQSHSLEPAGFLPPHPAHTVMGSSATGVTAGVFYQPCRAGREYDSNPTHNRSTT
jgi:hypothetical protein